MRLRVAPAFSDATMARSWARSARAYVGEHHPLVTALLAMAALLKLWIVLGMVMGEHRDRPGYAPVLITAIFFLLFSAWAAAIEIRKLRRPISARQHDQLVAGVAFVPHAQEVLDARDVGDVRGIDLWRALSRQLASQCDRAEVFKRGLL